ncbi:MAG: DUF1249 domain-containing protein [Thioalkalivibrio sp.]
MLIQDPKPAYLDPAPRSFAALMDLYEANYIRLRRLCPDLARLDGRSVSSIPGGMDLHLQIIEHTPYTSTARLTYLFQDQEGQWRPSPDLMVRMFHDARQVEVLGRHCRPLDLVLSVDDLPQHRVLACKWRLNRFLYKWLSYSLRQGHSFAASPASELEETPLPQTS